MEHREVKILDLGNGRSVRMPVNYQHFILNYSSNPENMGWDKEEVLHILECVKDGRLEELKMDDDLMNSIGGFFENGVCVQPDIEMAV